MHFNVSISESGDKTSFNNIRCLFSSVRKYTTLTHTATERERNWSIGSPNFHPWCLCNSLFSVKWTQYTRNAHAFIGNGNENGFVCLYWMDSWVICAGNIEPNQNDGIRCTFLLFSYHDNSLSLSLFWAERLCCQFLYYGRCFDNSLLLLDKYEHKQIIWICINCTVCLVSLVI